MAIIGKVERKSWKVRLLNIVIHTVLILGAATMVYPLLLMLSGSVKSSVDFKEFRLLPEYLITDTDGKEMLFRKYLVSKYNNNVLRMANSFKLPDVTFDSILKPKKPHSQRMCEEFEEFLAECRRDLPHYWFSIGMASEPGVDPLSARNFRRFLRETMEKEGYKGDEALRRINERYGTRYEDWGEISLPAENFFPRRSVTDYSTGILQAVKDFKNSKYADDITVTWADIEGEMVALIRRDISRDLAEVNRQLGTDYSSWMEITVPAQVPEKPVAAELWEEFVKNEVNPVFLRIDPQQATAPWRLFLQDKFKDIAVLNKMYGTAYRTFDDVEFQPTVPQSGTLRTDWTDFLKGNTTVGKYWVEFLRQEYGGDIGKLNGKYGTKYKQFTDVPPCRMEMDLILEPNGPKYDDFDQMMTFLKHCRARELPATAIRFDSLAIRYRAWLKKRYVGSISAMNNAYSFGYNSFSGINLPETPYGDLNLVGTRDWQEFVRTLPPEDICLARSAAAGYKKYVKGLYRQADGSCNYQQMSADYGMNIQDDNGIPAFLQDPATLNFKTGRKAREDYLNAVRAGLFDDEMRLNDPHRHTQAWQEFLKKKYIAVSELNSAWHLTMRSFDEIQLPVRAYEWHLVGKHTVK